MACAGGGGITAAPTPPPYGLRPHRYDDDQPRRPHTDDRRPREPHDVFTVWAISRRLLGRFLPKVHALASGAMKRFPRLAFAVLLAAGVFVPSVASAAQHNETTLFAVVMTRHRVRSLTHTPAAYAWPDWSPVAPGFLTAHGYRLMTSWVPLPGLFRVRRLAARMHRAYGLRLCGPR